ncbi:MAG TPA: hypothetical protein VGG64_01385 [Pirellulales bacterium]
MADDFQKRLDEELGTTLDALAADKARKLLAARLASEQIDERLRRAKQALDTLIAPHMQALAAKLGVRAARTGESDHATEAPGWYCAIPLGMLGSTSFAGYDGDLIHASVSPAADEGKFLVRLSSRLSGETQSESREWALDGQDRTAAQSWIDQQLIRFGQRHLGIQL